jgi:hypothetical protein
VAAAVVVAAVAVVATAVAAVAAVVTAAIGEIRVRLNRSPRMPLSSALDGVLHLTALTCA